MIKFFIITILLLTNIHSRENPFFPAEGEQALPNTTNKDLSLNPLKRAAISLPSSARTIQKVTIEYKNLDGSIEQRAIKLDNSVDWHLPVFVSQSMGSIKTTPAKQISKKQSTKRIHLFSSKHIKFYKKGAELQIDTNDKMIRDFLLTQPYRMVLDFKRDVNLKSQTKSLSGKVFKKISVGTHDGYYRVVVHLDGQYKYEKNKTSNGYSARLY
jgi:hypothetical protein